MSEKRVGFSSDGETFVSTPDMPADIAAAIDELENELEAYLRNRGQLDDVKAARVALDATILARLSAAEAARDTLERQNAYLRAQNHVEHQVWLSNQLAKAEAARDAACARAERAEKMLGAYEEQQEDTSKLVQFMSGRIKELKAENARLCAALAAEGKELR